MQVQAFLAQLVAQVVAYGIVEPAQEQFAAVKLRGLGTQAMENGSELDGDVAATHHQYTLGQTLEEEGFVGADGELAAGDVGNLRPAAGGDQDVPGCAALAGDFHRVRVDQPGVAFQQGDAAVHQQIAVDAVEALDLAVLVADQGRPVEASLAQGPAEAFGLFEVIGKVRTVDQQLFRHAADVDAGAAQVAAFGDGHASPETGREARRTYTAGTGTYYEEVEVVSHGKSPETSRQHTVRSVSGQLPGLSLRHREGESHASDPHPPGLACAGS
ncbi:hypothetical protein D9M69_459050 [compost metagenome]